MAVMYVTSERIGRELISIFGLESCSITSIALNVKAGTAAEVVVTRLVSSEEACELVELAKRFELTERQE